MGVVEDVNPYVQINQDNTKHLSDLYLYVRPPRLIGQVASKVNKAS